MFPQIVSCDCGMVQFQALTKPIATAVCYCVDCQNAGDIIAGIEDVKLFRETDGGTSYVTLHDKNWSVVSGQDKLESIKLKPNSSTTRYVTNCCNSPMFLKFKHGFWTSTYRMRYTNPPPLEWRNKTANQFVDEPLPKIIPEFKNFPMRLFGRLLKAWIFPR